MVKRTTKKSVGVGTEKVVSRYRPEDYAYSVVWSEADDAFIGRITEFPSLAAHGSSQELALREIRVVATDVLYDMAANCETIPVPISKRNFSGKLNVRMASELHRRLAIESERQGVSLNALINLKLAA